MAAYRAWIIRIAKWAGLALCPVVAAVWAASWCFNVSRDDSRPGHRLWVLRMQDGCLVVTWVTDPHWNRSWGQLKWWARWRDPDPPPPPPPPPPPAAAWQGTRRVYTSHGPPPSLGMLVTTAPPPPAATAPARVGGKPWWDPTTLDWRPRLHRLKGNWPLMTCSVPLWMVFAGVAGTTACLWWYQPRFTRPGHCRACGYNLAGLGPATPCPECGRSDANAKTVSDLVRDDEDDG